MVNKALSIDALSRDCNSIGITLFLYVTSCVARRQQDMACPDLHRPEFLPALAGLRAVSSRGLIKIAPTPAKTGTLTVSLSFTVISGGPILVSRDIDLRPDEAPRDVTLR